MTSVRRTVSLIVLCVLASTLAASAEPGTAWHIVRPGENLHMIALLYLGAKDRWPELARLNPEVQDPNRLEPGQRIRVTLPGGADTPAARVARLARKVEAQPTPNPWEDAQQDDLLLDRDGLRTFPKSSAEMAFADGTRLLVTESSLVFFQQTGRQLQGVDRKSVEIVEGQADVEAQPAADRPTRPVPEVEIVLGPARATARPAPAGGTRARARRVDAGSSKLMVYGGEGEVEAGGAKVTVPEGMGTSMAATGPPTPPEKLLPAPQPVSPAAGGQVACGNPRFRWNAVPDAVSYTVEVCRDPSCGALVERAVGLDKPEWRAAALPQGDLYWRATARSGSGLDGYPGEPVRLTVTSDRTDLQGPKEVLAIEGPQVLVADALWAGPAARATATKVDPETGEPVTRYLTQSPEELGAFAAQLAAAAGGLASTAVDGCGNAGSFQPFGFTMDAQAPEISWEVVALQDFPNRRRGARKPKGLSWSGGARWEPLEVGVPVSIDSDAPQLLLHGARFDLGDEEESPGENQMLRIRFRDAGAGVAHLRFQLRS
ncbi:MAG TPA: LysM peptidoglycan-binding domain-containing protein, partial [Thermoanaerobaculia bacterium]|nr:LysM peptidoglycan-binding domain-containing protein [Thermoanaerobaculia bacterium]